MGTDGAFEGPRTQERGGHLENPKYQLAMGPRMSHMPVGVHLQRGHLPTLWMTTTPLFAVLKRQRRNTSAGAFAGGF